MKNALFMTVAAALSALIAPALAQDATQVDAKHYKVEFENDQVRVLRVKYGVKEKSSLHEHPALVSVFLTDATVKMTGADGKSTEMPVKAGSAMWNDGTKHLPENIGDKPFEVILVEMKGKAAAKK